MNGAPVSLQGTVHVGVPGYTYNLGFQTDRLPIEPLANSFTTNAPGMYKGDLNARGQIQGRGITGPSLQNSLAGQISLSLTNLNFQVVSPTTQRLLEPIALVLRVPELTQTPLSWIDSQMTIGQGQARVDRFVAMSQAFHAQAQGAIQLAPVLTNSPVELPVTLSLRRNLAERANLVGADAPTDSPYVPLPNFVRVIGTVGNPQTQINKAVVSGLLLRTAGGIPGVGGRAGAVLEGLGGVLSGQQPAGTNGAPAEGQTPLNLLQGVADALGTRAPRDGTNAPPAQGDRSANLLRGIGNILGGQAAPAATNPPPANPDAVGTNQPPPAPAPINPLDLFRRPAPKPAAPAGQ
jgi:type II secretion system protein N